MAIRTRTPSLFRPRTPIDQRVKLGELTRVQDILDDQVAHQVKEITFIVVHQVLPDDRFCWPREHPRLLERAKLPPPRESRS